MPSPFLSTVSRSLLALCLAMVSSQAQTLQGKVQESKYGTGIDSVRVTLKGASTFAYSDATGRFSLSAVGLAHPAGPSRQAPIWDAPSGFIRWSLPAKAVRIRIFDMRGTLVGDIRPGPAAGRFRLPLESMQDGFHTVRIQADGFASGFRLFTWNGRIRKTTMARGADIPPEGVLQKAAANVTLVLEKKGWVTREAAIETGAGESTIPLTRTRIKVLIVDGFNNHNWKQTTVIAKGILDKTAFFDIDVTTSPGQAPTSPAYDSWNPDFKSYEAVILNICNINTQIGWPARIKTAFADFVSSGGGVYAFHAAAANFADWPEYLKIVGFTWAGGSYGPSYEIVDGLSKEIPAGMGDGTSHGARFDALIQSNTVHPINSGLPPSWLATNTEVYTHPRTLPGVWENVTPMGYALDRTNGTNRNWPVMILVKYGKGFCYTSLLGHVDSGEIYPARLADVGLHTTLIRSMEWMARKEIQYPVPVNFPTRDRTSQDTTLHFQAAP